MVFLGKCCICNKQAKAIIFIKNHRVSYCDNNECEIPYNNNIINYMIDNNHYNSFSLIGKKRYINIPRSSGKISIGDIMNLIEWDGGISFQDKHPLIKVTFTDKKNQYCKYLSYNKLSEYNFHLPLISIFKKFDRNHTSHDIIIKKQQEIYKYCIYTNKATKLIILSALYHTIPDKDINGYFGYLPLDIINIIIYYYFNDNNEFNILI